jgi:hypothetical protein
MLGSIWPFLKDPANLAVLGSIAAVIAAIAAFLSFARGEATSLHRSAQRERDRFGTQRHLQRAREY